MTIASTTLMLSNGPAPKLTYAHIHDLMMRHAATELSDVEAHLCRFAQQASHPLGRRSILQRAARGSGFRAWRAWRALHLLWALPSQAPLPILPLFKLQLLSCYPFSRLLLALPRPRGRVGLQCTWSPLLHYMGSMMHVMGPAVL